MKKQTNKQMKVSSMIFLMIGLISNIHSQPNQKQIDSLDQVVLLLNSMELHEKNAKFSENPKESTYSFVALEGKYDTTSIEIKRITRYSSGGAIESYTIPFWSIGEMELKENLSINLRGDSIYSCSLKFYSKTTKKRIKKFNKSLSSNNEHTMNVHNALIYSAVKRDYKKLVRIKNILSVQAKEGNYSISKEDKVKAIPSFINGVVAYNIEDLEQPPKFKDEKNIEDYKTNIIRYIKENSEIGTEDVIPLMMSILVNNSGKIEDVLFIDSFFGGTNEEVSKLDSLQKIEYEYIKKEFLEKDPDRQLKLKIKEILLKMPKWTPGVYDGKNVNTRIMLMI